MTDRELATVQAALRMYQAELSSPPYPDAGDNYTATNGGRVIPLTIDEIDTLCETLRRST